VPAIAAAVLTAAARQLLARPSPPPECRPGAFLPARPLRGRYLSRRLLRHPLLNLLAACRTDALLCLIIPRAQPAGEAVRRHSRPPRCQPAQTLLAASEQLEPGYQVGLERRTPWPPARVVLATAAVTSRRFAARARACVLLRLRPWVHDTRPTSSFLILLSSARSCSSSIIKRRQLTAGPCRSGLSTRSQPGRARLALRGVRALRRPSASTRPRRLLLWSVSLPPFERPSAPGTQRVGARVDRSPRPKTEGTSLTCVVWRREGAISRRADRQADSTMADEC